MINLNNRKLGIKAVVKIRLLIARAFLIHQYLIIMSRKKPELVVKNTLCRNIRQYSPVTAQEDCRYLFLERL